MPRLLLLLFICKISYGTTDEFIVPVTAATSDKSTCNPGPDCSEFCSNLTIQLENENELLKIQKDQLNAANALELILHIPGNSTQNITSLMEELLPLIPKSLREQISEAEKQYETFGADQVLFHSMNKSFIPIKYLIKKEANINIKNKNGETLLYKAIKNENIWLIMYILENCNKDINSRCFSIAIHNAVEVNNIDMLKFIIVGSNGSINFNTENGYVLLLKAINNNNLEMLQYLIELGNLNNTYLNNMVAFRNSLNVIDMCAILNNLDILKYLLETMKLDVNDFNDEEGRNFLGMATIYGNTEMVKYLINKQGMDFNNTMRYGGPTALQHACESGNLELVKYLIEDLHMDYNVLLPFSGETILQLAGNSNNFNLIKYLIKELKINVNIKNTYGKNVLTNVIASGNIEIVNYLIGKMTLDENDKIKMLFTAAENNNFEIFKLILEYDNIRDYINRTDIMNNTLLHYATKSGNLDIIVYVYEVLNIKPSLNKDKENILFSACQNYENVDVIKYLIKNLTIDANGRNRDGDTLLIMAAYRKQLKIMKYLIENENIDVNQNSRISNSLLRAAEKGNLKMVKYLIDKNINVNFQNRFHDDTALHEAAVYYSINALQYIILYGKADINIINEDRKTAFDIYKENKRVNNMNWFEDYLESLSNPDSNFETLIHDVVCDLKSNKRSCKFYYE